MEIKTNNLSLILRNRGLENKYILVHLTECGEKEPGLIYEDVEPIFDDNNNLVFFALTSSGLTDYYNKDRINWFRFYSKEEVEKLCKLNHIIGM